MKNEKVEFKDIYIRNKKVATEKTVASQVYNRKTKEIQDTVKHFMTYYDVKCDGCGSILDGKMYYEIGCLRCN